MRRQPVTLCSLGASEQPLTEGVRRLTEVDIRDIRGSIERARDYTMSFLPYVSADEERRARVRVAVESDRGVPPLELLELDGSYYVKDGHRRISVYRHLGVERVEAYVTSLKAVSSSQQPLRPRIGIEETKLEFTPGGCRPCTFGV